MLSRDLHPNLSDDSDNYNFTIAIFLFTHITNIYLDANAVADHFMKRQRFHDGIRVKC